MWHLFSFFSSDFCYFITRIFFFFFFWAWKWPTSQWRQLKATISHRFNFWYNFVCVIDTRGPHWKKWNSSKSPTIDEKERRDEHLGLFHCVTDVVERESGCPACCVWSKKEKGIEKDTWALWLDPLSQQFSLLYPRNANHNVLRRQPCITNDKKKPWEYIRRRGREYFAHKVPSLSLSSFSCFIWTPARLGSSQEGHTCNAQGQKGKRKVVITWVLQVSVLCCCSKI